MYLGRFILGEEAAVPVHATAGGVAVAPTSAPALTVYDAAGARVFSALMPGWDRSRSPALFAYRLRLGAGYAAGRYAARVSYVAGGVVRQAVHYFDVVAGGDAAGAVISMLHVRRPQADYLVHKTDGGKRRFGRGPTT